VIHSEKAKLRIIKGEGKGREFSVDSTPLFIGRGEVVTVLKNHEGLRLDLPDQSRSISRKHAKIILQGGRYQIIDTSVNGTLLNGDKISHGELDNKSTIEVGIGEGAVMLEFILTAKEEVFTPKLERTEPPKPSRPTLPQDNPFLDYSKVIHHFRHGESSESYVSSSSTSWKWFILISAGILILFLVILLLFR
jgi:pSer/pThr/pTyr-binding forkhead associated (FHA) protein